MAKLAYFEDLGNRLMIVNTNTTKRNALSDDLYEVIHSATTLAAQEARITSITMRGEGGFFCAGGDLTRLVKGRDRTREERCQSIENLNTVILAVMNCPKPVIAAVEGGAAGAGVSLAFACDFIVAEEGAKFIAAYVKAGLIPDGGMTSTLAAALPRAVLMQMAVLAEPITAERLYELGAIAKASPSGKVLSEAEALANRIAAGPSATQGVIKGLVNTAHSATIRVQMDDEREAMADAIAAPESAEGINAFLEKRPVDFAKLRKS